MCCVKPMKGTSFEYNRSLYDEYNVFVIMFLVERQQIRKAKRKNEKNLSFYWNINHH